MLLSKPVIVLGDAFYKDSLIIKLIMLIEHAFYQLLIKILF